MDWQELTLDLSRSLQLLILFWRVCTCRHKASRKDLQTLKQGPRRKTLVFWLASPFRDMGTRVGNKRRNCSWYMSPPSSHNPVTSTWSKQVSFFLFLPRWDFFFSLAILKRFHPPHTLLLFYLSSVYNMQVSSKSLAKLSNLILITTQKISTIIILIDKGFS